MKLTTTLAKIRACSPCESGYTKLVKHLGGVKAYGADTPINLLTILTSNGVPDMLWCLRATNEEDGKRIASQLAIEFAAEVLPIFERRYPDDLRPRQAIQAARDYLAGKIDVAALRQARSAAAAAAAAAAYAAAAAAAAAARAKAVSRQADIIKSILEE